MPGVLCGCRQRDERLHGLERMLLQIGRDAFLNVATLIALESTKLCAEGGHAYRLVGECSLPACLVLRAHDKRPPGRGHWTCLNQNAELRQCR